MPRKVRPIRIEGNIAYVPLTQGYEAIIDASDAPLVSDVNWCACHDSGHVYAMGNRQRMHRVIMAAPPGVEVDHIDRNGLNNTRTNLRLATKAENARNRGAKRGTVSGYKGVYWNKERRMWYATICVDGRQVFLGRHDTAEEAHAAYCEASDRLHGEFGRAR
jgi:hypothetical protein